MIQRIQNYFCEKFLPCLAIYRLLLSTKGWEVIQKIIGKANISSQTELLKVPKPLNPCHMPNDKESLEKEFSVHGVSSLFYHDFLWKRHVSCRDVDEYADDIEYLVVHFNERMKSDEMIDEKDEDGYRPATHVEAWRYAKKYPDLQKKYWIVALGSYTELGADNYVAILKTIKGKRILGSVWYTYPWFTDHRFLFVRKKS